MFLSACQIGGLWFAMAWLALASYSAHADQTPIGAEVQAQLALPEDKIDVADAALVFAKEINPATDTAAYSGKIDHLADEVRKAAGPMPTLDKDA